jgi:hypothetical protein
MSASKLKHKKTYKSMRKVFIDMSLILAENLFGKMMRI